MHELVTRTEPEVGEQGVRAVEHAQLCRFVRGDVIDDLRAVVLPSRARPGEAILDDPLAERLGEHRAFIAQADTGFEFGNVGLGRGRDDAVNHAVGRGATGAEPFGESGGIGGKPLAHQPSQLLAIAGQVVAAEQGQAGQSGGLSPGQRVGKDRVESTLGQGEVERTVRRAAIALLGNREADEMACRRCDPLDDAVAVIGRDQHIGDSADHARLRACGRSLGQRVESVLRDKLLCHRCRPQRYAGNRPARVARVEAGIGIPGLVRPVERANAEMDDAVCRPAVECRHGHVRRQLPDGVAR